MLPNIEDDLTLNNCGITSRGMPGFAERMLKSGKEVVVGEGEKCRHRENVFQHIFEFIYL